ncbi:C-type lectin domain family 4 member F-like isoform X1 [Cloeon dipterum]|uniref:C-type lectin domain family 4 member F-like isoform X1 n=1 Tax=Cloeon dipterum TaxID=197152 RepID=UPI00322033D6
MSPLWIFLVVFLAPMVMAGGNVDEKFDEIKTMFTTLLTEVGILKKDIDCLKIRQSNQALTTLENGKTYHMYKKEVTWDEANTYCKSKMMALASPKTLDDLRLLQQSTQRQFAPGQYWLSATDAGREPGNFAWHDGEILPRESQLWDKQFMRPNKLFGNGKKTCVALGSPGLKDDRLYDFHCLYKAYAVCELASECL